MYRVDDDEQWTLRLVREEHVLVVPGRGFNWPHTDHLRIVTLPPSKTSRTLWNGWPRPSAGNAPDTVPGRGAGASSLSAGPSTDR